MKKAMRVLIVDDMHESILPLLRDGGYDPVYLPVIDREGILAIIQEFDGLIIRSKTNVDQELIDKATQLKFVARAGAGVDQVDLDHLNKKGIKMINAPEGNRDALGEQVLGMLLSLLHRITVSHFQIKQGIWDRVGNRGIELKGKVVGIYGMGNMGKSFAEKLTGMSCEVIGYDIKTKVADPNIRQVSLEEFMKYTEILSIHIPYKKDTHHLFNRSYLEQFSQLKVVLNTARGGILRTKDLVELMEEGKIFGAALDVLENEKFSTYTTEEEALFKRLSQLPNVIITPHVAGWTYESYARINEVMVQKLREVFS